MEALGWLLAYVVGFGLVQLLLYRHFHSEDPSPDATPGTADGSAQRSLDDATDLTDGAGVHCDHCGAFNETEATYAYCRECVRPLR